MPDVDRGALIEEIMSFVKPARGNGLIGVEPMIEQARHPFLRESLLLALDVQQRAELQSTLETKIRLRERQGETDAKVLEVAGGFAPTIGVLGTVVGLIDVLRQFSNLSSVAGGIGTAFVSTIYGLALANVLLLPAAHRIRVRVAETFEIHEMISEAVLWCMTGCIRRWCGNASTPSCVRRGAVKPRYLQPESGNRERWVVSYMDMLTILLIFFIAIAAQLPAHPPAAPAPPAAAPTPTPIPVPTPVPIVEKLPNATFSRTPRRFSKSTAWTYIWNRAAW